MQPAENRRRRDAAAGREVDAQWVSVAAPPVTVPENRVPSSYAVAPGTLAEPDPREQVPQQTVAGASKDGRRFDMAPYRSSNRLGSVLTPPRRLNGSPSRLNSTGGCNICGPHLPARTDRESVQPESVTYVLGMNCHPCDRNGPERDWLLRLDSNQQPSG